MKSIPAFVFAGVISVLAVGAALVWRAEGKVNQVALADAPRPVTVIPAPQLRLPATTCTWSTALATTE